MWYGDLKKGKMTRENDNAECEYQSRDCIWQGNWIRVNLMIKVSLTIFMGNTHKSSRNLSRNRTRNPITNIIGYMFEWQTHLHVSEWSSGVSHEITLFFIPLEIISTIILLLESCDNQNHKVVNYDCSVYFEEKMKVLTFFFKFHYFTRFVQ